MKSNKGFSLVELIVVIAIMAIIAGVAIPVYSGYITKAETSKNDQVVAELVYAAQLASLEHSGVKVTVTATKASGSTKANVTVKVVGTNNNDIAQDIADIVSGSTKYTATSGEFKVEFAKGDVTAVAATTYENGQKTA